MLLADKKTTTMTARFFLSIPFTSYAFVHPVVGKECLQTQRCVFHRHSVICWPTIWWRLLCHAPCGDDALALTIRVHLVTNSPSFSWGPPGTHSRTTGGPRTAG